MAFICNINEKGEYLIEILYEFNDKTSLENYFKEANNIRLKYENKNSELIDDQGKKNGIDYENIEKDKN